MRGVRSNRNGVAAQIARAYIEPPPMSRIGWTGEHDHHSAPPYFAFGSGAYIREVPESSKCKSFIGEFCEMRPKHSCYPRLPQAKEPDPVRGVDSRPVYAVRRPRPIAVDTTRSPGVRPPQPRHAAVQPPAGHGDRNRSLAPGAPYGGHFEQDAPGACGGRLRTSRWGPGALDGPSIPVCRDNEPGRRR